MLKESTVSAARDSDDDSRGQADRWLAVEAQLIRPTGRGLLQVIMCFGAILFEEIGNGHRESATMRLAQRIRALALTPRGQDPQNRQSENARFS